MITWEEHLRKLWALLCQLKIKAQLCKFFKIEKVKVKSLSCVRLFATHGL